MPPLPFPSPESSFQIKNSIREIGFCQSENSLFIPTRFYTVVFCPPCSLFLLVLFVFYSHFNNHHTFTASSSFCDNYTGKLFTYTHHRNIDISVTIIVAIFLYTRIIVTIVSVTITLANYLHTRII